MKKPAVILCIGILLLPITPAVSAEKMCGPPGYRYPCPPTSPIGPRTRQENEEFRKGLEDFRTGIEKKRAEKPGRDLEGYREALEDYREGIADYRRNTPQ